MPTTQPPYPITPRLIAPPELLTATPIATASHAWLGLFPFFLPVLLLGGYYLALALVLQVILFLMFGLPSGAPPHLLPLLLPVGLLNAAIEACSLLLPVSLYLTLSPSRWRQTRAWRWISRSGAWIGMFLLAYLGPVQYFFFEEFSARFNLVAVDYLIYPHEVFVNILEAYPVIPIAVGIAALTTTVLWLACRRLPKAQLPPPTLPRRLVFLGGHALLATGLALSVSTHSFDFADNRIINEIAADGLSSFFEALRTNELNYRQFYRTQDTLPMEQLLAAWLATDPSRSSPDAVTLQRTAAGAATGLGTMNVVVIVEESFGCEHVDACGQGMALDEALASATTTLTPHFDALARQGFFFNRAYATGTRTVRGLEAITASFPPIPSESIIKRPGGEHISTWGRVMRENGYHTSFLYGGYSQFDNMKTFYAGNGFEVRDRLNIEQPRFANIWGVSDQDLFRYAQAYFDKRASLGVPFFSIVMTTSNHSPYTFPEGIDGVQPQKGGRQAGTRYADHALGQFFADSSKKPWFQDTLFVVVADHGARVYGSEQFPLGSYEIPLLVFAPGHLPAREIDTPISQIDIAPTVLGLLGLPYTAPFFGQDILAGGQTGRVLPFNHNHDVALYRDGKLAVLGLQKTAQTYRYPLGGRRLDAIREDLPLTNLATAYYQTAFDLFTQHQF